MQTKLSIGPKTFETFLAGTVGAILLFYAYLSFQGYFADSEIWSLNLGFHFPQEWTHSWVFTRTFFYLPLYVFTGFLSSAKATYISARLFMYLNTLAQVFFVFRIILATTKSRTYALLGILLIITNTFYSTQAFRIRSDLISATLLLAAIFFSYSALQSRTKKICIVGCLICALLSTPKAVFIFPAVLWVLLRSLSLSRRFLIVFGFTGAVVLAVAAGINLRLGYISDMVGDFYKYLLTATEGDNQEIPLFSVRAFEYVNKFLSENWLFVLYLAGPFFLFEIKRFQKEMKSNPWLGSYLLSLLVFIFVPDKLPFFICSLIPFFTLAVHSLLAPLFVSKSDSFLFSSRRLLGTLIVFVCSIALLYQFANKSRSFLQEDSNYEQMDFIAKFERYLDRNPGLSYYDVVGVIPQRSTIRHFAGPHQVETNELVAKMLVDLKPDLLLKTAKFEYLMYPDFQKMLDNDYISVSNGVYARAKPVYVPATADSIKDEYANNIVRPGSWPLQVLTKKDFLESDPKPDWRITRVSLVPVPMEQPRRPLEQIFAFDKSF